MDHFKIAPVLLLVGPAIAVLGLTVVVQRFSRRLSPTIPYAGDSSLVSRLSVPVLYGKDPVGFLCDTRKRLGDVFCVDLFVTKIVFILGPEGNKDVLRATEDQLSFWEQIRWALGPLLEQAFSFGDWITVSAKLVRATVQRQDRIVNYVPVCEKISEDLFQAWSEADAVPLFSSISSLVLSHLFVILLGEEFYKNYAAELVPLMGRFEREVQSPILRVVPEKFWGYTKPGKFLFRVATRFDELVGAQIKDILDHPDQHSGRTDYLYDLISQVGDRYTPVLGSHIMSMIFAGHTNVAMTVPWMFLHARRTPGALERIREDAIRGAGERKLFLEACLRETGRLYTNTSILRMSTKPITVHGHVIPKGVLVGCSPAASQRADAAKDAPGPFADAGRWNPDRFLGDPGAYQGWVQRGEFVQFGMGTHQCPGERLARIMMFDLVLKVWMANFDIEVVSGLEEGTKGVDGVGVDAAWTEENFGTPAVRGKDVLVRVTRK